MNRLCTDPNTSVRDILEVAAARWAIEEYFHDVKEIWGAGQQQVRNVWSNIGCWNLNGWLFTRVELCPWDHADRRPSHADRRRHLAQEMLRNVFPATPPATPETQQYHTLLETLLTLLTLCT